MAQIKAILDQLTLVAQEAHDDVRGYIMGIRAGEERSSQTFFAALEQYLDGLRERYGLQVHVSWPDDVLESPLTSDVETQLLRIIQEALTNLRRHAGVDTAQLLFTLHADELQVVIADEGQGFAPPAEEEDGEIGHFGLSIMRERAESVGGNLEMRSSPGEGTRVIVRVPLSLVPVGDEELGRGVRILLVDDHPLYLEGLKPASCAPT